MAYPSSPASPASPPSTAPLPAGMPRVAIIGCGFGGLEAARALAHAPVRVTLVDRHNHHLFQPLLYQVATAGLPGPSIAEPIRHLLRGQSNLTVLLGEVSGIDVTTRCLHLADGGRVDYDHLIVAAGATHGYFGHDDWAAHAPGLKTLDDALAIRRHLLLAFEAAERAPDDTARRPWLTFAIVGAGPTGVELAGTLAEIAHRTLRGEFRNFDPADARVLLIEGGPRVLPALPEGLGRKALDQLRRLGVEVLLETRVTGIDATGLQADTPAGPLRVDSRCMVWAAGVAASPLARLLGEATGAAVDRAGRVAVLPDLSLPGHPEISVVGDMAAMFSHAPGREPRPVPGISPGAKQAGRTAAANLQHRLRGEPTLAFRYRDYGNLATIGRHAAVVDLATPFGPLRFSGTPAWLFWLFAHIYFLIGFRNRLVVLLDWASAYFRFQRPARVMTGMTHPCPPASGTPPPPPPPPAP